MLGVKYGLALYLIRLQHKIQKNVKQTWWKVGWKPANISWNIDSSPKKSSVNRYLQFIHICHTATLLYDKEGTRRQCKAYSEVAVSIRSFCKLLKRTSYGYFCDFASAIWGINAGWSISWYQKAQNKIYTTIVATWQFERINPSGTIDSLKGKEQNARPRSSKGTKNFVSQIYNSFLLQFKVAIISWIQVQVQASWGTRKYRYKNVWSQHNGLSSAGRC